uniref:Uncharacterized protein n=1 Tax=Amphimedon queenslandica TaxID=400682 RepID=A0A1X7SKV9_AMPQE
PHCFEGGHISTQALNLSTLLDDENLYSMSESRSVESQSLVFRSDRL